MRLRETCLVYSLCFGLACIAAATVWAYDYEEEDPTQGAGPNAAWRAEARWDIVDEESTREIHRHTTDPDYLTPLVSYVPDDPNVPSPRDFLGYIAGAEGHLTRPKDEIAYFQTLAATSPRVTLLEMGTTEEGRTMHLVLISDAVNLVRTDELKGYTAALADPRTLNAEQVGEVIEKALPIVHITAGLHSPETGPPEMVMELAYRLAVSKHPDIEAIRKNTLLMITPITEVDGRAKVVDWYYRYLTEYDSPDYTPSDSPPYWGAYTYHDNNRDGIQMSQKLTQNYMKSFIEWHPTYSLDLHESVPFLYVSTGTGPYNRTIDPITIREWQWVAHWELAELQRQGLPGVWTWGFYTGWNPSYLLWITNNHNALGRFYETFGNGTARTIERDLSDEEFAGRKVTSQQWYRADPPPKKVMWSLRNNTNYMQSGVLASLNLVARNGDTLLRNFWQKGVNSIQEGRDKAPYAWVIPADQPERSRVAYLVNQLRRQAIDVHRATEDFTIGEEEYARGDFVVRLDQPYGRHARNLLAKTKFPTDAEHRPYDDVSWTLGLIYRVNTVPIDNEAILENDALALIESPVAFPGKVTGSDPEAYAVKHSGDNTMITARYMLAKFKVTAADEAFEANGETFPAGSWIIPHRRGMKGALTLAAQECMLDFHALDAMPEVKTHVLDLPRVALYHNWVSTQNDGWVRFTLEEASVPFDYIGDYTIRSGGLRGKYDVIIIAHQGGTSAKRMIHGRDPKFGAVPYTRTKEFPSHGEVDSARDITGGIGFKGLGELEAFLNKGGTLMLLGSAGRLATETGLVRNVNASSGVNTPGSSIQTKVVRRGHPIAYGFDDIHHVFRTNGPVYSVPKKYDHWIVAQYGTTPLREEEDEDGEDTTPGEDDEESDDDHGKEGDEGSGDEDEEDDGEFLLSGYIDGQSTLEKKGVVLDIPRNQGGRVLLYSFNPLHRFLNHGDHNYVYNALLNWNDFPEPQPKDHPGLARD